MKACNDMVVTMHYTLTDDSGTIIDSSAGHAPMNYLHGHANIVPGLEKALEGAVAGFKAKITVAAAEGYGEIDPEAVFDAPREHFPDDMKLTPGMLVSSGSGHGGPLTVVEVTDSVVVLDGNHPLAGKTLHFEVEVVDVRAATREEMAHGHAHSGDGHHH